MKKKEFAILVFMIAVLAFYISSEKDKKTHYELPEFKRIETDDIDSLAIKNKTAEIRLSKEEGQWFAGPEKFPADNALIKQMLETLAGLELTALASEAEEYLIYGLDRENRTEVTAFSGKNAIRRILIGKPAASYRHTFLMIDNDSRVFHAAGNIKAEFNRTLSDLRDKRVLAFSDEINQLTLEKNGERLTVTRKTSDDQGEKWEASWGVPAKGKEIDGLIHELSDFLCDGFIYDRKKEDFTAPVFSITLKGAGTYSLSVFEKEGEDYPAVSSGSPYPFRISQWKAGRIMKDFSSVLEKKQQDSVP